MAIHFTKMHGAGNDFVLVDARGGAAIDAPLARAMGDRHRGVGFDQLLTIESTARPGCVAGYRIWNSDGSLAEQCGNGARCVAAWLVRDGAAMPPRFRMASPSGDIEVECLADGRFELDMGVPGFEPADIPLRADCVQESYPATLAGQDLQFSALSMGNPHAVIVVDDIDSAQVATLGTAMQASGFFPSGVNVGFAQILSPAQIRLRVFERGAGETLACGSGACAAVVALVRQGRLGRHVDVHLPGGTLTIDWADQRGSVRMSGPATFVFEGEWLQ